MGFGMRRSLAIFVALFVIMSGVAVAAPLSFIGMGATPSTLTVNITAPQQGEYVHTNYAVVTWEANDTEHAISSFYVYLDSLSDPVITIHQELNLSGLTDGLHYVVVRAYNEVGGHAEAFVSFFINTHPPQLSILSPSNGNMLNYSDVTVAWQASDSVGIAYFEIRVDEEDWIKSISFNQTSNTFSNLADGHHTVTVMAYSWGGKTSTALVSFDVDTTYPVVSISQPTDGQGFSHSNVTVKWVGSDAGNNIKGYQIWVDGVYTTFAAPSEDSFTLNYADGHHTVKVVVVDTANSTDADEISFYVDTVAPQVASIGPEGSKVAVDSSIVVVFTKPMDPNQTSITVTGVSGIVAWNGTSLIFTPDGSLENGKTYTVVVVSKDMLGTTITKTWTFTVVNKDNPLAIYGMLAAVIGVIIVGILFYMSRVKKQEAPSRSWKGTEEQQRRSSRKKKKWDDEDEEDDEQL
jgi:hypothetical protein